MDEKAIDQVDPMQLPSWSIGMACVWIATRSPYAAARLWKDTLEPLLEAELGEMKRHLVADKIKAAGITRQGRREWIPAICWHDIEFSYDLRKDHLEPLAHAAGEIYSDVRVSRQDVLDLWPQKEPTNSVLPFKRKTGPKTDVLGQVKRAMTGHETADLRNMTEEAMSVFFGASRDTCRRARNEVLSELGGQGNLDK